MGRKLLAMSAVVLAGVLVLGAVAVWLVPGKAEAAYGRLGGSEAAYGEWPAASRGQGRGVATAPGSGLGSDTVDGQRQGGQVVAEPVQGNAPVERTPIDFEDVVATLDESEVEALLTALDDEYKAWATYDQVIADFGAVRPFTSIQRAEESHISALETLLDRYGIEVPANEYVGTVAGFDSLDEACAAGVDAEISNGDLYDQLFEMVDNPDIVQVFTSLQQASETKHLPAFERCAP